MLEESRALYQLICQLQVEAQLKGYEERFSQEGEAALAKEYAQIYKIAMDLLDKMVELLGEERMGVREYREILTDFIEQDSVLCQKKTQMAEQGIYYLLEKPKSPYELDMREIESELKYENYMFGTLGTIEDQYNYIVVETFDEYSEKLRATGFIEERYERYSLFYKK